MKGIYRVAKKLFKNLFFLKELTEFSDNESDNKKNLLFSLAFIDNYYLIADFIKTLIKELDIKKESIIVEEGFIFEDSDYSESYDFSKLDEKTIFFERVVLEVKNVKGRKLERVLGEIFIPERMDISLDGCKILIEINEEEEMKDADERSKDND
jgi:hypothetical protein